MRLIENRMLKKKSGCMLMGGSKRRLEKIA
jgi:hypothetical protein